MAQTKRNILKITGTNKKNLIMGDVSMQIFLTHVSDSTNVNKINNISHYKNYTNYLIIKSNTLQTLTCDGCVLKPSAKMSFIKNLRNFCIILLEFLLLIQKQTCINVSSVYHIIFSHTNLQKKGN